MAATLEVILDTAGYGSEIGARLYSISDPEVQVGADVVLPQGAVTHRYAASLAIGTYPAGNYRVDVFRSSTGTLGAFLTAGFVTVVDGKICTVGGSQAQADLAQFFESDQRMKGGFTYVQVFDLVAAAVVGDNVAGDPETMQFLDGSNAFNSVVDVNGNRTVTML